MGRRTTKKQAKENRWTQVACEILRHTSALAKLLRDAEKASLEQACSRLREFGDRWVKSGEGDNLPCSGEHADVEGELCDVDVTGLVVELLEERIEHHPSN